MVSQIEALDDFIPEEEDAEEDEAGDIMLMDVDGALEEVALKKKIQAWPSEVTVSGQPESIALPGRAELNVGQDGSQTVVKYDKLGQAIEKVSVDANGVIQTSDANGGKFDIQQKGDRTYVTTPSGDTIVVEGGRIVKTNTGGQSTEMLTPAEAKIRELKRAQEMEEAFLQKTANNIATALANGNVPVEALRSAYQDALNGFFGKKGLERLTARLNEIANAGMKKPEHEISFAQNKGGGYTVSYENLRTGDSASMSLEGLNRRMPQIPWGKLNVPAEAAQGWNK